MQTVAEPPTPCAKPRTRPPQPARAARRWRRALWLGGAAVLIVVGAEAGRVLLGSNFHTVLPGRVYRGAQPDAADIERLARDYGIKTIVNLRGSGIPNDWYMDECRAVQRAGIAQEDVCMSSGRLPPVGEVRRLIEVLDRAEYPIYLHCWRGADRTGLAAAMVLLLQTDLSYARAMRQLGIRYGHVAVGRPAFLDEFFTLYSDWLARTGKEHSPRVFREWALEHYRGGWCTCRWERVERTSGPLRRGEPITYQLRIRNTGDRAWELSPHSVGGIHLAYRLLDANEAQIVTGRAGLVEARVPPGGALDVTVALPPIHQAGRYRLFMDMIDARHGWFYQTGSEPLEEELDIRE